jgi:hypothetical protein
MMTVAIHLLMVVVASLFAASGYCANLPFETQSKAGGSYVVEIATVPDFSKLVHVSKPVHSVRYQWTGAANDQIYHWRTRRVDSKETIGRGTYAVIGPGVGFASLMWDDQELSTSSFDLTNEIDGKKSSLERLSQNWSSRQRTSKVQLVSVRPAGMNTSHASFVASMSLTKANSKNLVQVSQPKKLASIPLEQSAKAAARKKSEPPQISAPLQVSVPVSATKQTAPLQIKSEAKSVDPSKFESKPLVVTTRHGRGGMPTSRLLLSLGGEYSLIKRSKAEVDVDSTRPSGRMDLDYTTQFAGRGIFGLGLHESSSKGRATVESDFALPEINLPSSSRRMDLLLGLQLFQTPQFRLGLGLSLAQNRNWAIALAYSSLDGGALFEQYTSETAGLNILTDVSLTSHLVARINASAQAGINGVESRVYNARADLLYHIAETFEFGASGGMDRMTYQRCHSDAIICEREGAVTSDETRSYVQLVFGYAWGATPSN